MYIGSGLSSLSVILIKYFGWRSTYNILALSSLVIAFLIFLVVREKKSEELGEVVSIEPKNEDDSSFKELFKNPVNKLVIAASFIR